MKPTNQATEMRPAQTAPSEPRQAIAIGICGAIGGASVIEVFTSTWLHPAAQPTADPLALAGALIGVAVTFLIRHYIRRLGEQSATAQLHSIEAALLAETAPLSPMAWQPIPHGPFSQTAFAIPQAPHATPQREPVGPGICPHTRGRLGRHVRQPIVRQTPTASRIPAQG